MVPLMFVAQIYFPYGLLAPLAIIGIALSLKQWRKYLFLYLVLASYLTTLLLFFLCARFRQPLVPILLLFAVYAVQRAIEFYRRGSRKNLVLFVFFFVLLTWESNHNLIGLDSQRVKAEDMFVLGTSYLEQDDLAKAESYYRQAIRADSTHGRAFLNLGYVYSQRGKYVPAMRCFERAVALEPMNSEAYLNYATTLATAGRLAEAAAVLERAREILPLNDNIHMRLCAVYFQLGRMDEAKASIQESLRLNPKNQLARRMHRELFGDSKR